MPKNSEKNIQYAIRLEWESSRAWGELGRFLPAINLRGLEVKPTPPLGAFVHGRFLVRSKEQEACVELKGQSRFGNPPIGYYWEVALGESCFKVSLDVDADGAILSEKIKNIFGSSGSSNRPPIKIPGHEIEGMEKWHKWGERIPYLNLREDWRFKILPPLDGAMVRFVIETDQERINVYLDCFNYLGKVFDGDKPYWHLSFANSGIRHWVCFEGTDLAEVIFKLLPGTKSKDSIPSPSIRPSSKPLTFQRLSTI